MKAFTVQAVLTPREMEEESISMKKSCFSSMLGHLGFLPLPFWESLRDSFLSYSLAFYQSLPGSFLMPRAARDQSLWCWLGFLLLPSSCPLLPSTLLLPLCYKPCLITFRHPRMLWWMMIASLMVTRHWKGHIKTNEQMGQFALKCNCK